MKLMGASLAVVAAVLLLAGCSNQSFTTTGTMSLMNNGDGKSIAYETVEGPCSGGTGYDDIRKGADVTVYDAAGKIIGTGKLGKGTMTKDESACVFPFTVDDVPAGVKFYQIEVAHRGKLTEKEANMQAGLELTLGN